MGWLGAAALLGAYVLVSTGRLTGKSAWYNLINMAGGLLLAVGGWTKQAWPSVTLNLIWVVIGVRAISLARRSQKSH